MEDYNMPNKKKVQPEDSRKIAENNYDEENKSKQDFPDGLELTNQQIKDQFMEGTIDQKIE